MSLHIFFVASLYGGFIMFKVKQKLKKIFSYKGVKVRDTGALYTKYLTKRKYKLMGVKFINIDLEYPVIVDKFNNEYVIIECKLRKRNKINDEDESINYSQLNNALDNIESPVKTFILTENTNLMKDNIDFIENLYHECQNVEIEKHLAEELGYARELNQYGESSEYKFILYRELQNVLDKLCIVYNVHILNYEETVDRLFKIHNF